eukprot:930395_1
MKIDTNTGNSQDSSDDRPFEKEAVVRFFNTFNFDVKCDSVSSLKDGIVLFLVLCDLAPDYFNRTSINVPLGCDATSIKKNLALLTTSLQNFFDDGGVRSDSGLIVLEHVDTATIARSADEGKLMKLIQLVLLCAVRADPERLVERVYMLDDDWQKEFMFILKSAIEAFDPESGKGDSTVAMEDELSPLSVSFTRHSISIPQSPFSPRRSNSRNFQPQTSPLTPSATISSRDDFRRSFTIRERSARTSANICSPIRSPSFEVDREEIGRLRQRNTELDELVESLETEKRRQSSDLARLTDELAAAHTNTRAAVDEARETERRARTGEHAADVRRLESACERAEAEALRLRAELDQCKDDAESIRRQADSRSDQARIELNHLRDQLDIQTEKARQVRILEETVAKFEHRLINFGELKSQLNSAQIENRAHLDQIDSLKEQCDRIPTLKMQISGYKDEMIELRSNLQTCSAPNDLNKSELSRKSPGSELSCHMEVDNTDTANEPDQDMTAARALSPMDFIPEEVKQELARLRIENRKLKVESEQLKSIDTGDGEDVQMSVGGADSSQSSSKIDQLEDELDTQQRLCSSYLKEIQSKRKEVEKLSSSLSTLRARLSVAEEGRGDGALVDSQRALTEVRAQAERLKVELAEKTIEATTVALKLESANAKVSQCYSQLEARIARNTKLKERLRKLEEFVPKAQEKFKHDKGVLEKSTERSRVDRLALQRCQKALQDSEQEVEMYKKLLSEQKVTHKREEELMASAFYGMGQQLHRDRLGGASAPSTGKFWLSQ